MRADPRAFVAETRFSGAIVTCEVPRAQVARLLPESLRLGAAPAVSRNRHPVVVICGEHDQSKVVFASLPIRTGVRFPELVIAVPYVHGAGPEAALFVHRVFSGEPVVTWSGNAHYGYAKRMVPMEWLGDTFVVNEESGRLLMEVRCEPDGPWAMADEASSSPLRQAVAVGRMPVLGCRADGELVRSWFEWDFDGVWIRPIRAFVSGELVPSRDGSGTARGVAGGCLEASRVGWRISWPDGSR
jgi:hypothetical protein